MPSQFPQFYDCEAVTPSSDFVPSKQDGIASGINCTSSGTIVVDAVGFAVGSGGTSVPIAMVAGEVLQLAIVKVHAASTGSYTLLY